MPLRAAFATVEDLSMSEQDQADALPPSTHASVRLTFRMRHNRFNTSWLADPKRLHRRLRSTRIPRNSASGTLPAVVPPGRTLYSGFRQADARHTLFRRLPMLAPGELGLPASPATTTRP